jgi:DNA-binding NtrC family response regulator
VIGNSPAFREAVRLIERIAQYDVPVLILGESGTGKELAARAIHYQGSRRVHPFIPVNCGALPDTLIESELFGHERGAFTDARTARVGLIGCANGGTLFLDEVDCLSQKAQVTLLRFLQDQQYRPLGGDREQHADTRIIAATNRDLEQLCTRGQFRLDLYYRLSILDLRLPPLRERPGDPTLLARHFAAKVAARHALQPKDIEARTLRWFECWAWPGNVRELENLLFRAVLLSDGDVVDIEPPGETTLTDDLRPDPLQLSFSKAKADTVARFERLYVEAVLKRANGNVTLAAQLAGKERRAFGKLLKKHAVDRTPVRPEA